MLLLGPAPTWGSPRRHPGLLTSRGPPVLTLFMVRVVGPPAPHVLLGVRPGLRKVDLGRPRAVGHLPGQQDFPQGNQSPEMPQLPQGLPGYS